MIKEDLKKKKKLKLYGDNFSNLLYMLAICRSLVGFSSHSLYWFVRLGNFNVIFQVME